MKIVSFLFQIVAVAMPLEKFPGYPEKFKILNLFEKNFMGCMGDAGGATVLIGLKCVWHMSCIKEFPTNRQLVFSSFFPFLKRLPPTRQPFSVLGRRFFYIPTSKAAGAVG